MEFKKFKKLNYMCPKDFAIIFYVFVYTIDIAIMGSDKGNMCFVIM